MEGRRPQNRSRVGSFLGGMVTGIFLMVVIFGAGILYLVRNPRLIVEKAVDMGMDRVVTRTLESLPREHIRTRENEIADLAQRVVRAYSQNRISPEDLDTFTQRAFSIVSDQKVTSAEVDEMIALAEKMAGRGQGAQ